MSFWVMHSMNDLVKNDNGSTTSTSSLTSDILA